MHPGCARRQQEGDEVSHVLDLAVADDARFAHEPRPHLILAVAAALHLGLDAPPLAVGLDEAWMDAVDLHAVVLAAMGERLREGRTGGVDGAADGEGGL